MMAAQMTTSPHTPPLQQGDRLTRDEFERRYAAMPALKKAELIEGVVYMGSPVRHRHHGRPDRVLQAWLVFYEAATPGLDSSVNCTVRLDGDNEAQPDLLLRLPERAGGRSRVAADGYLEGAPELIVEVAASSVSYDLHQKLDVYRRSGVAEYVVHRVDDGEVDWFQLERGTYTRQRPDRDGVLHSRQFPGLCLSPALLLAQDLAGLRALVERTCGTAGHAALVRRLAGL